MFKTWYYNYKRCPEEDKKGQILLTPINSMIKNLNKRLPILEQSD